MEKGRPIMKGLPFLRNNIYKDYHLMIFKHFLYGFFPLFLPNPTYNPNADFVKQIHRHRHHHQCKDI